MTESIAAWAALLFSAISIAYTALNVRHARRSADAAEAQVAAQRAVAEAAAQPYVWADVQINDSTGHFLCVVVGNSGPTVATDVRVTFTPPLPLVKPVQHFTGPAMTRLARGIGSLAPGKRLNWVLGASDELLREDTRQVHRVTINCTGPFGPLDPLIYDIDLSDIRESQDRPEGTLHLLTKAVGQVATEIKATRAR
jgi:hypothetical protein